MQILNQLELASDLNIVLHMVYNNTTSISRITIIIVIRMAMSDMILLCVASTN